MSQADLAEAAGVSERQIRRLERGEGRPSLSLLTAVAEALRMSAEENTVLWALAVGAQPLPPPRYATAIDGALVKLVDGLMHPAYIADLSWTLLHLNSEAKRWFAPLQPGDNVAVWLLTDPRAQDVYVEWEKSARSLLAQIRALYTQQPQNPALGSLVGRLQADATVRRMWEESTEVASLSTDEVRILRPPWYVDPPQPNDREYWVLTQLVVLTPLTTGDQRRIGIFVLP